MDRCRFCWPRARRVVAEASAGPPRDRAVTREARCSPQPAILLLQGSCCKDWMWTAGGAERAAGETMFPDDAFTFPESTAEKSAYLIQD